RVGSTPPTKATRAATTPAVGTGAALGADRCSAVMTSTHTGAAPVTPLTLRIGSPEKLPTHTPTGNRREKPMHQLSGMSLLVPVLTAVQNGVASTFSRLNVVLRLSRSESMSPTTNAASADIARRVSPAGSSGVSRSGRQTPSLASAR